MMTHESFTEEQIELAARALRDDHANRTDTYRVPEWENMPHGDRLVFRGKARAALTAAAGVAPREPSVGDMECALGWPVADGNAPTDEHRAFCREHGHAPDHSRTPSAVCARCGEPREGLAVPVVPDEAKIRDIVISVLERRPYSEQVRQEIRGLENAIAREVAPRSGEWLRGGGR